MPVNGPRVTGYSVCRARDLLAMHTHVAGEETNFYQVESAQNMFAVWHYMPVDVGEVVTEVWQRRDRLSGSMSLLVRRVAPLIIYSCNTARTRITSNLSLSS